MKILFAASEAFPLIKTGGLGDVIHGLPVALKQRGIDVALALPAYKSVMAQLDTIKVVGRFEVIGAGRKHSVRIIESRFNNADIPLLLIDIPKLFERDGGPYMSPQGDDWHDNAERFAVFSRAVAQLGTNSLHRGWLPDIIHCHDWQTGMVPAFLSEEPSAPATVFTIHNLAYAGLFNYKNFSALALPPEWWSPESIEFYGDMSMLKAGLLFADEVTTVSPRYAYEITTPEFGYGMDGVLRSIQPKLMGILNGIDHEIWDPQRDQCIASNYSLKTNYSQGKYQNKQALYRELKFANTEENLQRPLLGFVGRLVEQKGIDLILSLIPPLLKKHNVQMVILGTGEPHFEQQLSKIAVRYPQQLSVQLNYSEKQAHLIEAAADIFLMPSRFEPCGLNQLYSLRYGTLPIVHYVGGLADSVVDATDENIDAVRANGFHFAQPTAESFMTAVEHALTCYQDKKVWNQLIKTAMSADFSWEHSSEAYVKLYRKLMEMRGQQSLA